VVDVVVPAVVDGLLLLCEDPFPLLALHTPHLAVAGCSPGKNDLAIFIRL
jgi:hypothetical protein